MDILYGNRDILTWDDRKVMAGIKSVTEMMLQMDWG